MTRREQAELVRAIAVGLVVGAIFALATCIYGAFGS